MTEAILRRIKLYPLSRKKPNATGPTAAAKNHDSDKETSH